MNTTNKAKLLHVVVRVYNRVTEPDMLRLLRARKKKSLNFASIAYDVEELPEKFRGKSLYNVRMEFTVKEE